MHKRVFSCLVVICMVIGASISPAAADDLTAKVLADAQFDRSIEITIIPNPYWGWQSPALDLPTMDVNMEDFLRLLVAYGYGIAGENLVGTFKPTDKLKMIWREEKSWPNSVYHIPIARRKLIKVTYQNRWKELGIEQFSVVFSYKLEPLLLGLKESEVLTGKIESYLDPSDGKWSISESSFNDNLAAFIKSNLGRK